MNTPDGLSATTLDATWEKLIAKLKQIIGKRPADLNAVLFLIGVQELGKGPRRFTKEQKQDLLHVAVCRVLSLSGFYQFDGYDLEGWPQFTLTKPIPQGDLLGQEDFLKEHVIQYFQEQQVL